MRGPQPQPAQADAGPAGTPEQHVTGVMNSAARTVTDDPVVHSYLPSTTNAGQPHPGQWCEGMGIGGPR